MTDLRDIAKSLNCERIKLSSLQEITGLELQRINQIGANDYLAENKRETEICRNEKN